MDNTYVFITSDHGEEFMRHGGFDHASLALYEEGVSVPMIVLGPDIPVNRIVDRPVQCMDLFASVLQKAGIPAPEDMDARPLFSADGDTVFQPVISETLVFRELIPHMAANYLVDNHTQVWAGRVRPRRPELSVAEAIDLEFGAESGNLVETAPGHLESTFDVDTMHFVLCDEPGTACFLIIEAYTRRDLELKQNLIDSVTCGYPDRPVTAPDGWTVEAAGTCGFGLPPEYRMERSLACQSIMDGRWKLILDQGSGIAELYDIEADPMEQRDRAMEFPDVVDRLRSALADRTWIGTYDSRSYADKTVDDETMKQLEILGYAYSD